MSQSIDLSKFETKRVKELRRIWTSMDSPDAKVMYSAAGKMMAYPSGKALLPKAIELLDAEDMTIRRLMFRTVARNAYGNYVTVLFDSFGNITPAEREQVLQVIEEKFKEEGAPSSPTQQKIWISALEKLGREHQPTIVGIMAYLGRPGTKWVTNKIKSHVETISLGAIQKLTAFPENTRKRLIKLITQRSLERKRELIPYILDIMDKKTIRCAEPFLKNGNWRERVIVATRVAKIGLTFCSGIVMDIIADSDWRVKQALLENINIAESKFSALMRLLGYVATDSHARVRGAAERLILRLGAEKCLDTDLETQRKRIERKFRKQLLRAAPVNKDVDSAWLGVEMVEEPTIPFIDETSEGDIEGLSLEDFQDTESESASTESVSSTTSALLAALRGAKAAAERDDSSVALAKALAPPDTEATIQDKIVEVVKRLSKDLGNDVPLDALKKELASQGVTPEEFEEALAELERDGMIYQSGKGTVSYVDIDL